MGRKLLAGLAASAALIAAACQPGTVISSHDQGGYLSPASLTYDLSFDRFQINQSVPAADSDVSAPARIPVVADRDGLVRAFVTANESGGPTPSVVFRYTRTDGSTGELPLGGPGSAPTTTSAGDLATTFNAEIDGSTLSPGLRGFVVVDPDNDIAEADESNNRYPESGMIDLGVVTTETMKITIVPVVTNGATPAVGPADIPTLLRDSNLMLPIGAQHVDIRASYTYTGVFDHHGAGWLEILGQVAALRDTEAPDRYYHAVVQPTAAWGVVGIGRIGDGVAVSRVDRPSTIAHEFGHNLGLQHAPCGGASVPDLGYPYSGAVTNTWGYNSITGTLVHPSRKDFMSYCSSVWISDYNYKKVLDLRAGSAADVVAPVSPDEVVLTVSGTIGDDGSAQLDPAFTTSARAVQATTDGSHELLGFDANGDVLVHTSFDVYPVETARLPAPGGHGSGHDDALGQFTVTVPVGAEEATRIDSIEIRRDGVVVGRRHGTDTDRATSATADVGPGDAVAVEWDADAFVAAMIIDPATGETLAVDDDGLVEIATPEDAVIVVLSDGVASTTEVVPTR